VSDGIREFTTGDKISITTTINHPAHIAGIRVLYRNEDDASRYLAFVKGQTERIDPNASAPLPEPYLNGRQVLETTVYPGLKPGTYVLSSVEYVTAGRKWLLLNQGLPEERLRILPEPNDPPSISGWEVQGDN
jgi:hypothetical protein